MPTHATYLATRQFGSLDGLRFLCITAVLWHHTPLWPDLTHIAVLFARGHVGVDFFFVLSGYLITTLLLREEAAKGRFSLRGFYWRRALRILPVYVLVITAAAFKDIVLDGEWDKLDILPYYYLFLANFIAVEHIAFLDPTWSLAMEEQYYLLWPTLLLLLPRHWIGMVLGALIAINVLAAAGVMNALGLSGIAAGPLYFSISGATYAPILMGTLAAMILHRPAGFAALAPVLGHRTAAPLCLGAVVIALAGFPGALEGWPNLVVHGAMTATVIALVMREDNGLAALMHLRPIVRIGQISYGIYLYHLFSHGAMLILFPRLGLEGHWMLFFFAYYALTVVIAEISFRTYETWFLKLRHKPPHQVAAGQ